MSLTQEQLEYLHDIGKMPDWAFYQQDKQSPTMNLQKQTNDFNEYIMKQKNERQEEAKRKQKERDNKKAFEKDINKQIETAMGKALHGLLEGFGR